jgi:hypothetical protein
MDGILVTELGSRDLDGSPGAWIFLEDLACVAKAIYFCRPYPIFPAEIAMLKKRVGGRESRERIAHARTS